VQLVSSHAHAGLKKAIARCCQGCSWQRCRVRFARSLLARVPKGSQDMVAAALRWVFVQAEAQAVEQQWDQVITMLSEYVPAGPSGALVQDLEHQSAGAAQQGDQTPHPCGRHLPHGCRL